MLNSLKINNWDIYNNENILSFQYEPRRKVYSIRQTDDVIELGKVFDTKTPDDFYTFKLSFDESKFSNKSDYYGIKYIYSDRNVTTKILYSSYLSWNLNTTPYIVVPKVELENGITVKTSYTNKPAVVLYNAYPITNSNSTSEIESIEFGFKDSET